MIKLYVLAFLALALFICYIVYKIGRETSKKKGTDKSSLDEKIKEIKSEIAELENGLPLEIEKNSERINQLKIQLERVKQLSQKLN